jgi:predicted nucleotidyltransferase
MTIPARYITLADQIAQRFSQYETVQAVAIGGSLAGGYATDSSDMDLYIYTTQDLTHAQRADMITPYARLHQTIDYWGPGDVYFDAETGIEVDLVYFNADWMTDQIARVLDRHEAWMGYTTAFWHTVKHSHLIYDRTGWLSALITKAQSPYPDQLIQNIVDMNHPVLREIVPSYRKQIESAIRRDDLVSVNHRVAALMASYFDIIFAVNRIPHPGEKRQLEHAVRLCRNKPLDMEDEVKAVLQGRGWGLIDNINHLINHLDVLLEIDGYLPLPD